MFFDIIIGIILIWAIVSGFRKGFVFTFIHTLGWFGSMVIALFAASPVRKLAEQFTDLDDKLYMLFLDKLSLSSDMLKDCVSTLPPAMNAGIDTAAKTAAQTLAQEVTLIAMTIFSFLALLLIIKVIFFFVTIALSKRDHNKGFRNIADGIFGLAAGALRGAVFVFLFLALLIPVVNIVSPTGTQMVLDSLDASYFAKTLYDNNLIVTAFEDFLSRF